MYLYTLPLLARKALHALLLAHLLLRLRVKLGPLRSIEQDGLGDREQVKLVGCLRVVWVLQRGTFEQNPKEVSFVGWGQGRRELDVPCLGGK